MADNQMQTDGDEAKGHPGDEYEEIREQVRSIGPSAIAMVYGVTSTMICPILWYHIRTVQGPDWG